MAYDASDETFGFESLEAYKAARAFRNRIYDLIKLLPGEEKYALGVQMRKAAVSLTNNIAEGHGRYNWQDSTRFCRIARGSLAELADDLNTCLDLQYAEEAYLRGLKREGVRVMKLLNGYIAYLQEQQRKGTPARR